MKPGENLSSPQTLIQSTHKYDGNMRSLSGLRLSSLTLTKWFNLFRVWDWVGVYFYFPSVPACILRLDWNSYMQIRRGADKSLAQLSFRCRRTESIVSLERGACSCAELQVFSCYRGWKETCKATRGISTTSRRELTLRIFSLQDKTRKEIHVILIETLREHAPSYATVKNWAAQFKPGDFFTCVAPRPGRTKIVTTPEIIDQIQELILEDRRFSAKWIAEILRTSCERVGSIINEGLDMRKLFANLVQTCLNTDKKRQRCQSYEQIWNFFGAIQMISCRARLVTMDETLLYHYEPETKQQSTEWQRSDSPWPK